MTPLLVLLLGTVVWYIIKAAIAVARARKRASELFDSFNSEAREASRHTRKGGWSTPGRQKSKKIDPSVGEYVEFEEISTTAEPTDRQDQNDRTTGQKNIESQITDAEWEDI